MRLLVAWEIDFGKDMPEEPFDLVVKRQVEEARVPIARLTATILNFLLLTFKMKC